MIFSPYTYLFFIIYIYFLLFMFFIRDFLIFWVFIELAMLRYLGLSYTIFSNNFSSLMYFFLIQTLSSFLILVFYIIRIKFLLTVSIVIKLAVFPFFSWYVTSIFGFPNVLFFLASTFHKLPPVLILFFFQASIDYSFLIFCIIISLCFSGLIISVSKNIRLVLIYSSIGNNAWFILSQFNGLIVFLSFFFVYSLFLYLCLNFLNYQTISSPLFKKEETFYLCLILIVLSGLPPFPLFYTKIVVILFLAASGLNFYLLIFFMIGVMLIIIGYIKQVFELFFIVGGPSSFFLLK